ncbi:MAG: gamma-glutamyltransferase, partial [Corynebacterium kroppenstedtii]|nr:gamma-glutamyltransferase [Corynebacterium kroppenstedtii]
MNPLPRRQTSKSQRKSSTTLVATQPQQLSRRRRLWASMMSTLVLLIASGYAPASTRTANAAPPAPNRDISVAPESNTDYRPDMTAVQTDSYSVSTANPVSTAAARDVLATGGTAADALVTAQLVLGLVAPQSSGIGGGGYILYHDATSDSVTAIDGRETAPDDAPDTYLSQISSTDTHTPEP